MHSVLEKIIENKQREIAERSKALPSALIEHVIVEQADVPRNFFQALDIKNKAGEAFFVGEVLNTNAQTSGGEDDFSPVKRALALQQQGVTCLCVPTDEHLYHCSEADLDAVKQSVNLPVMQRDFIIDQYQVLEARAMGADCILLMPALLSRQSLCDLMVLAYELGLSVLVEVSCFEELEKIVGLPIRLIGINANSLHAPPLENEEIDRIKFHIPPEIVTVVFND